MSEPAMRRRGMILILSSPSGAGKTTLTRMLLQDKAFDLTLSISVTTRPRRSSEVDGVHYHFIDRPRFDQMKGAGELLESAEVHGSCYGTPRAPVMQVLAEGRDMLFDIDWQGALQVRETLGADVVSIFILPPSMRELRARLERRAEDSGATIEKRLANSRREIERWRQYDYVIINDDLQRAYAQVSAIVAAERAKGQRVATGVAGFVETLLKG
jgi:guanylate kinase